MFDNAIVKEIKHQQYLQNIAVNIDTTIIGNSMPVDNNAIILVDETTDIGSNPMRFDKKTIEKDAYRKETDCNAGTVLEEVSKKGRSKVPRKMENMTKYNGNESQYNNSQKDFIIDGKLCKCCKQIRRI